MIALADGQGVPLAYMEDRSPKSIRRMRVVTALCLSDQGWTHDQIALYLGLKREGVTKMLARMPAHAVEYYRRARKRVG